MLTRNILSDSIRSIITKDEDYLEVLWGVNEFNVTYNVKPNMELQANLIVEETIEFLEELREFGVTPNLLKETIDIVYVLEGLIAQCEENVNVTEETEFLLKSALNKIEYVVVPVVHTYFTNRQLSEAFAEVQRSNLSKLDEKGNVLRREDGKVLKSDLFSPAEMATIFSSNDRQTYLT